MSLLSYISRIRNDAQTASRTNLDLSFNAVSQFWRKQGINDAINAMEQMETWTVAGTDDVESALADLATRLSSTSSEILKKSMISSRKDIIDLMGFLKSGRAILILRWMSDINPDLASVIIDEATNSGTDFGTILIERMRVLDRQQLLSRVFSPERLALVVEILAEAGLSSDEDFE